jgi:hypothetical protein
MALTVPPAFATPADVVARWKPLTPEETTRAEALLEDASQQILDEDQHGILGDLTAPTLTLKKITCAMVIRAMASGVEAGPPVTQDGWNAGPFGAQKTYANPTGDLYLTKAERKQLGFSRQRAASVDMWPGETYVGENAVAEEF